MLRSTFALFSAPEKAQVREPMLTSSPFVWGSRRMHRLRCTSALLCLGIPRNVVVTLHWEGKARAANSDFARLCLGMPTGAGPGRDPTPKGGGGGHPPPTLRTPKLSHGTVCFVGAGGAADFVSGIRRGGIFLFHPMCLYSKYSEFCGEFKNA